MGRLTIVGSAVAAGLAGAGAARAGQASPNLQGTRSRPAHTCEAAGLGLRIVGRTAGADSAYTAFSLLNRTHASCGLAGYPRVEAVLVSGRVAHLENLHAATPSSRKVDLAAGHAAYFTLQTHGGGSGCVHAAGLRFTIPRNDTTRTIRAHFTLCDHVVGVSAFATHPTFALIR
jgi:hypothetical protein